MNAENRWIRLDGAVNIRDLGGLPTVDGRTTCYGQILRSDNLQDLTAADLRLLLEAFRLKNIIDLRSEPEIRLEGPGPLTRLPGVTIHRLSLFSEGDRLADVAAGHPGAQDAQGAARAADTAGAAGSADMAGSGGVAGAAGSGGVDIDKVLPWQQRRDTAPAQQRPVNHYLGYLRERADSIVAALRVMARADGAAVVHCAAGKDRTGVVCALALEVSGVTREAIVADYTQTGDRLEAVLDRLRSSDTYAADLDSRPADIHQPYPAIMEKFLAAVDERLGGTLTWLTGHGWTAADTAALRARLLT